MGEMSGCSGCRASFWRKNGGIATRSRDDVLSGDRRKGSGERGQGRGSTGEGSRGARVLRSTKERHVIEGGAREGGVD